METQSSIAEDLPYRIKAKKSTLPQEPAENQVPHRTFPGNASMDTEMPTGFTAEDWKDEEANRDDHVMEE